MTGAVTAYEPAVAYPDHSPVQFDVAYQDRYSRGLPFVKSLLLLPHYVAILFLELGFLAASLVAAVAVIVRGRYPRALFDFAVGGGRWLLRVEAYAFLLSDAYPPFAQYEQPADAVRFRVDPPPEGKIARWRPLFAWVLVLPQVLMLAFVDVGMALLLLVAFASIVLSGTFPRPLFDFVVRALRFHSRVTAYAFFMTERYPGFTM